MEKEQTDNQKQNQENLNTEEDTQQKENSSSESEAPKETKELSSEEKITELEDKLARTFAEMENQRRRFEKEKEDAFEYGGYSLSLIHISEPTRH